ncbi:MAG: acylphosphatase [Chloroflexi bacterium]|nr:acylphosphatase [Chloroflexota bacterium]
MSSSNLASLSATVYGKVQGVFFRAFVYHHARALGLRGFVSNLPEGRAVEVFAEGERKNLEELLRLLHCGPSGAWVEKVEAQWEECGDRFASFEIKH